MLSSSQRLSRMIITKCTSLPTKQQLRRHASSVSNAEVSKFSEMSQDWWNPDKNPLLGMNPIRTQYIQQHAPSSTKTRTATALDVGCGAGILSESLARLQYQVTAIDPSLDLINCAKQHSSSKLKEIEYQHAAIEDLDPQEYQFDVICILEVLEHVDDIPSVLQAASKLLKPDGGRLFVSTVNRTLSSYALAIVGAEYVMRYLKPGTHEWNRFLSPEEVRQHMEQVGLEQSHVQGMVLQNPPPPIGSKWDWAMSDNDMDVNWIATYQHRMS